MTGKSTRSKKKESETDVKVSSSNIPKRHVFFSNDNLIESGQDIRLEKMRHPGTEDSAYFIYSKSTNKVYEVHQFNQPHRSWFIDETVSSNGKCNVLAPFDSLLFGFYYLQKECSDKAMPLDQIRDADYPKTTEVLDNLTDEMILKIADRKGPESLRAFKFNKDKALSWLALKVELLIKTLKAKNIQVSDNAISANYVKEEKDENFEEDYIRFACGIVGHYIVADLRQDLQKYLNLAEVVPTAKRKSLAQPKEETQASKKIKTEDDSMVSPPPTVPLKEKKETAKEKALKKAASGTKSIASFFKK